MFVLRLAALGFVASRTWSFSPAEKSGVVRQPKSFALGASARASETSDGSPSSLEQAALNARPVMASAAATNLVDRMVLSCDAPGTALGVPTI